MMTDSRREDKPCFTGENLNKWKCNIQLVIRNATHCWSKSNSLHLKNPEDSDGSSLVFYQAECKAFIGLFPAKYLKTLLPAYWKFSFGNNSIIT